MIIKMDNFVKVFLLIASIYFLGLIIFKIIMIVRTFRKPAENTTALEAYSVFSILLSVVMEILLVILTIKSFVN